VPLLFDSKSVRERLEDMPSEEFPAGTSILAAGTSTGKLFILVSGTARVSKDDVPLGELSEPGAVIGELSALLGQPHGADVHAVTDCTFRVADAAAFLQSDSSAALLVATILARRLDAANTALVEVRKEVAAGKPQGAISRALDKLANALRQDIDPELARYVNVWM
jgi:CRP-like cAMP-binding protein